METEFTVWSSNIQGWLDKGPHAWKHRRFAYQHAIRQIMPDLAGFQEVDKINLEDLSGTLEDHQCFEGREVEVGRYVPIVWNTQRFHYIQAGSQYLNLWPDQKEVSLDARHDRAFTWVYLFDAWTGKCLIFINTHLDHIGEDSRVAGINQILNFVDGYTKWFVPEDTHIIITGDFNSSVYKPKEVQQVYYSARVFEMLTGAGFMDAFRSKHGVYPPPPTFTDYKGDAYKADQFGTWYIDPPHTRNTTTTSAKLIKSKPGKPELSDHTPVLITLDYPPTVEEYSIYL